MYIARSMSFFSVVDNGTHTPYPPSPIIHSATAPN